ncbi:MAG TPA: RagB/SusD family nutrient uptake outer membrane protein, partial [Marinilabiliales bacterium]|nr:RagB/SusD family nutrient uptake outer membrane protein [Marinilabiliales bacterium]
MKKINIKLSIISVVTGIIFFVGSCTEDLLDRPPTTEVFADAFWKTEADATTALLGAYSSVRPLFDRDYYFDGQGEYVRCSGATGAVVHNTSSYVPVNYGNTADKMFTQLYGGVHRTNYVIENVRKMLPDASASSKPALEAVIGEACLLRGMIYFRLISMWGDVPYISKIIYANSEVASLARMPIGQVKDSIMADFTYAFEKLPVKGSAIGRAGKPAALAFRGKLQLFWACWNKFGWPELDGFVPDQAAATAAYTAAAADFKAVIENYGLNLFRSGEPGDWGTMGNAEILPNYFYMFIPSTGNPNADGEMIMVFTHGGTGTGQSEELVRDFGGRSVENSQCFMNPRYEIADRYQLTTTGDFAPKLIPTNPSTAGARTKLNSAVNPASYANRDYRMKSSILWDYEMIQGILNLQKTDWVPFIYKTWGVSVTINGVKYISYNTDRATHGYTFRKFLRNYEGQDRSSGDYNFPVMRLADVFLMYAEATNEVNGPQADA